VEALKVIDMSIPKEVDFGSKSKKKKAKKEKKEVLPLNESHDYAYKNDLYNPILQELASRLSNKTRIFKLSND
jgi:hypothetical protein